MQKGCIRGSGVTLLGCNRYFIPYNVIVTTGIHLVVARREAFRVSGVRIATALMAIRRRREAKASYDGQGIGTAVEKT